MHFRFLIFQCFRSNERVCVQHQHRSRPFRNVPDRFRAKCRRRNVRKLFERRNFDCRHFSSESAIRRPALRRSLLLLPNIERRRLWRRQVRRSIARPTASENSVDVITNKIHFTVSTVRLYFKNKSCFMKRHSNLK